MPERTDQAICFTHFESEETFDISQVGQVEELFADILFNAWLDKKSFKEMASV